MAASVQSMCQYWKNFDLQELQKELDIAATELSNRQEENDASRKRLVEQSREFKKTTAEDIRKIVAPLLKSFQSEVDALSKRSKASEAVFLSIYKKLIDLPDPVPALELSLQFQKKAQKVQEFEVENKELRATLKEYDTELAEVRHQEVTLNELREKVRSYEEQLGSAPQNKVKDLTIRGTQKKFTHKEIHSGDSERGLAKKLGDAEKKVTALQHALEGVQSELVEVRTKYDESTSAKSDEMEMVVGDLDRANERASEAEREIEQLTRQLASATQNLHQAEQMQKAPDMEQAIDILKCSSLEVELTNKEKEISQLVQDVQRLQTSMVKLREVSDLQIAKLEEEVAAKSKAFRTLEEKMRSQEDYEELKRELNILKSVEFHNSREADDVPGKALETLLLEKNRLASTDSTQHKGSSKDLSGDSPSNVKSSEDLPSPAPQRRVSSSSRGKNNSSKSSSDSRNSTNHMTPSPVSGINGSHNHMGSPPPGAHFYGLHGHHELVTRLNGPKLDQNNGPGLETAIVAKTVRELLSIHNLGQRLFAKHVLGLSQGTVSELLSKPKSWDKLTEKGRESYRKMYAWASDERNVMALKELSPRKGTQPLVPTVKREDAATEQRIAQILSSAKQAMHGKKGKTLQMDPVALHVHEQLNPAMVASIYQQEMLKMARVADSPDGVAITASMTSHRAPHAHSNGPVHHNNRRKESRLRSPGSSGHRDREAHGNGQSHQSENEQNAQEMVARIYRAELAKLAQAAEKAGNKTASTMYQQELARLAQNAQVAQHSLEHGMEGMGRPRVKMEAPEEESQDADMPQDLSKHSRHSTENRESNPSRHSGSAFKLVHPRLNGHGGAEAGYGTPIPPDCVSPLQRMQNIANSLMSRNTPPSANHKPLKAVLPPIAQEQFDKYSNVNTEDLVKKVKETLSQYSISQRLFGENVLGLSQGSVSDLLARPKPWHMLTQKGREPFIRMQIFLEDAEAIPKLVATQYRISPDKLMRHESSSQPPTSDGPLSPPPDTPHSMSRPPTATPTSQQDPLFEASLCGHYFGFYTNSIFEIAAMTPDLDTVDLTSKIKDVLQFHNLGQKLFGEAVLGLSQGSVSELLSKPKPWSVLSIKGKEPFVRMLIWLNDPYNIEKLKLYQTEAKANRRRKSSMDEQRSCETPIKRPRVFFTEEQKETLRTAYANDPYPNQSTIEALAGNLNVGVKTVVNWFHNHRMRAKQQQHTGGSSNSNSFDYNPLSVKSEPGEDNSNLSDGTSGSGDTPAPPTYRQGSGGEENNQWLFPQFELVRRSQSSESQQDEEGLKGTVTNHATEKDGLIKTEEASIPAAVVASSQSGVKKRKSSHPKWVYEGTQLDKTQQRSPLDHGSETGTADTEQYDAELNEEVALVKHERDGEGDDSEVKGGNSASPALSEADEDDDKGGKSESAEEGDNDENSGVETSKGKQYEDWEDW